MIDWTLVFAFYFCIMFGMYIGFIVDIIIDKVAARQKRKSTKHD